MIDEPVQILVRLVAFELEEVQKRIEDDRLYGELIDRLIARLQRGERGVG